MSPRNKGRRPMLTFLLRLLLVLVIAYPVVLLLLYLFQSKLLYIPGGDPGEPYAPYRSITARTADGRTLKGWHQPCSGQLRYAVICLHGNGGNRSNYKQDMALFPAESCQVFSFDWGGYGGSEGSPHEEGLYRDGEAMLKRAMEVTGLPVERVIVLGRSLGCAVAVELARRHSLHRVVLLSPFTSLVEVASRIWSWVPVRLLLRARYDNLAKAAQVTEPVLVVAGERDSLVPAGMSRRLAEALPRASFTLVPGGGHNSLLDVGFTAIRAAVIDFIGSGSAGR